MPRFKNKGMDKIYQGLVGKTPEKLYEMKIFGSVHDMFKRGYDQLPAPCYLTRNSAAYVAGKETAK